MLLSFLELEIMKSIMTMQPIMLDMICQKSILDKEIFGFLLISVKSTLLIFLHSILIIKEANSMHS